MTTANAMEWSEAHATLDDPLAATEQAASALRGQMGAEPIDLVLAFFNAPFVPAAEGVAEILKRVLSPECLIGASGSTVVTTREELDSGAAITLLGARLPGVTLRPFILVPAAWGEAMSDAAEFARHTVGVDQAELVLLFGDPFTLDVERVLRAFDRWAPGIRVVGGMASAGMRPSANALLLNDWVAREGGIALALSGDVRADVVVSQGCRPIGPVLEVTSAQQNVLIELDGQPALERTEQVLGALGAEEREMLQYGLYVGRAARGEASGRGDWLIRNLLGADRDHGVLAVGDRMVEGERIRLHVRDAQTATEDLEMLLSPQAFDTPARGAMMFTCNGRGRAFFGVPHRDIGTLQEALGGQVPAAGLACAGEIGPVGERSFLHGHTASIVLLRPRGPVAAGL